MDLITYLGLFAWFVILCIWHRTLAKVDKSLMEDHKFMKKQMDAVRDLNEKAKKLQEEDERRLLKELSEKYKD